MDVVHPKQRARQIDLTSPLSLLTLAVLIADFADVPRGRPLRHLREAAGGMELATGDLR